MCTRPHYCQPIRHMNKRKRVAWCKGAVKSKDDFANIIFSDECTVQLEHHGRICYQKRSQPRKLKPRPKHPPKLHIWGAVSFQDAAQVVLFTEIMDAELILERSLVLFIQSCYPAGHQFQQDNDPKHTSRRIERYFESRQINWWRTPPECLGIFKQYLKNTFKPKNMSELQEGIQRCWHTLMPQVCQCYINHLHRVIPKVLEVAGEPSGY